MPLKLELIRRKISLIQGDLALLETIARYSLDEIAKDPIKQAALERVLERTINRAIDINQHIIAEKGVGMVKPPFDYKGTFNALAEMDIFPREFADVVSLSVGTRNFLIHEYDNIDSALIYVSVKDCLADYATYCDYILKYIEKL